MQVTKRDGEKETFSVEKIHKVVSWAVKGINGVSLSDVEMNANLSLYDGISSTDIQTNFNNIFAIFKIGTIGNHGRHTEA